MGGPTGDLARSQKEAGTRLLNSQFVEVSGNPKRAVMANQAKSAYNTDGGEEARREVGKNPECFPSVFAFYEHHTGDKYVPGAIRAIGG